jgi:hypothetical protein
MSFIPILKTSGFFRIKENYQSKKAIVFLTVDPDVRLFDFAKKLASDMYHVYISINSATYSPPVISNPFIFILQINDDEAEQKGYRDCCLWVPNKASARCKALYYFGEKNTISYDSIWILEDDVYIPSVNTLSNLDLIYSSEIDLLCTVYNIANTEQHDWHWKRNKDLISLPWAGGGIMGIRISPNMINSIRHFLKTHDRLLMDELMFHTLALHDNLKIIIAPELKHLVFRHDWKKEDISENLLFHPIKSYQEQLDFSLHHGFEHYNE